MSDKRIRDAARRMNDGDSFIGSTDLFICNAIGWIVRKCGDIHIEYMKGDDWGVSTCHDGLGWKDWKRGNRLQDALAEAVLAAGSEATHA